MVDNNYYIGIDVGSSYCKAVAINNDDSKLAAEALTLVKGNPEGASNICIKQLSSAIKVKSKALRKKAVATGQNGEKITIKEKVSEITCLGIGVHNLDPEITIVVDIGSFSMKAVKIGAQGKVLDFMMNDKCAAGSGILLELVGEGLELKVDELSDIAFESKEPILISSQCSIFAESEVISYKNEGANIPDIIAGVCNSVAGRIYPLIRKLDKDPQKIAFVGGVAKNEKIVENLEERIERKIVKLPIDPQFIAAYGAAVIAKKGGN